MFEYFCGGDINKIPNDTTHLIFDNEFNEKINNLPNSIIYLEFGNKFNQKVNKLPNSITHLTFGYNFNQKINNLPNSITHLTLGMCFNNSIDNLPNSITHLTFGANFNQSIDKLPNSIIYLNLGYFFNNSIDGIINFVKIFNFENSKLYEMNKEKLINKHVIYRVNYFMHNFNDRYYLKYCYKFNNFFADDLNEEISYNIMELQYFIHNIFFKKLIEYVFNPQRLLRIAEKYNLTFDEYMDFL